MRRRRRCFKARRVKGGITSQAWSTVRDKPSSGAGCYSDERHRPQAAGIAAETGRGFALGTGTLQPGPGSTPSQSPFVCYRSGPLGIEEGKDVGSLGKEFGVQQNVSSLGPV